jgi:hypothetical protein
MNQKGRDSLGTLGMGGKNIKTELKEMWCELVDMIISTTRTLSGEEAANFRRPRI